MGTHLDLSSDSSICPRFAGPLQRLGCQHPVPFPALTLSSVISPQAQALSCSSKFEAELRAEQEERKREEETRRLRQAAFQELKAAFSA